MPSVPSVVTVACGTAAGLDQLPGAARESAIVKRIFGEGVHALGGEQATKAGFRNALVQAAPTCVHLATHGVALTPHGVTSALIFCPGIEPVGMRDDGRLTIGEIYDLPLADLPPGRLERVPHERRPRGFPGKWP